MRENVIGECLWCKKEINTVFILYEKRYYRKFCSKSCAHKLSLEKKQTNTLCGLCSKPIYRSENKVKRSKYKLFFCSTKHKDEFYRNPNNKEFLPENFYTSKTNYRKIVFDFHQKQKTCNHCGYSANELALVIHHKDRNHNNNEISNLEVLCCNCHLIEHYENG